MTSSAGAPRRARIAPWTEQDEAVHLGTWAALLAAQSCAPAPAEPSAVAAAVDILRRHNGRRIAEAWHGAEASGDAHRAFAALRRSRHPLTGIADLTLLSLAADDPMPLDALLTEVCQEADRPVACELAPLPRRRAEILALMEKHGFAVTQIGIRLPLDPPTEVSGLPPGAAAPGGTADGLDLHPMRPDELDFVRSCLVTAVRRGLAGAECRVPLEPWVAANLPLPPEPDTLCVVGTIQGTPVCHAAGRLRTDEFTRARVVDVVDSFVLPEWKSRGLSRLVTTALLRVAAAEGCRAAHSTVVADGGHEPLLAALSAAGWKEVGRQWRRG